MLGAELTLQAVVFDFDGLIIDSEWLIFETARTAFAEHGHELTVEAWSTKIGTNSASDDGWWERLCRISGVSGFDQADYETAYLAQPREGRFELPALPGVTVLLHELTGAGIPIGSSEERRVGKECDSTC